MPAYVLVDAEVYDHEAADRYRVLAEESIARYGGRYLIQGTVPEAAEGGWPAGRVVTTLEFPDMARLREWHTSPEYARAAAIRAGAIDVRMLFAEGTAA
ncbi:DUF1330 domain-containing protein [Streptomyces sp. AC536]|uniref:DUF1330 domain-containing protein n=1 Tax=Streptomyces buecherae TaxID=2763006 RepID=UPI00164E0014|nr:DUF1330 domain-containing protein [Streptomyces buecherae]MBC3984066.1 DUF1330 domain-containing protein [Streptomyces buecherae]QNJ39129.1 DUF1330 domain-containing protein [Streptomyces buecherae]